MKRWFITCFVLVMALAVTTQAELLTSNRGFELGDTTDWMQWGSGSGTGGWVGNPPPSIISDGTAYEGTYYAQITAAGNDYWGYNVVWQGEATEIGVWPGVYTMSAQVRSTDTPDPILKVEWYDSGGGKISEEVTHNAITMDDTWQLITQDFTAPANTHHVKAVIGWDLAGTVGGSFSVDYDDVSLVPEPATLALLGLGSLFLRRRK